MSIEEKLALLEDAMEIDEGTLTANMDLSDIEEYDSMSKLSIIVMVEDEFGKKLTSENFRNFEKVQDILDVMS